MKTLVFAGILLFTPALLFAQEADPYPTGDLPRWDLSCYPNPTSDLLVVSSSVEIKDITLIDLNGQVVKATALPNWCFSLHDLPSGWIFVYVESTDGRVEKKNIYKH